MSSTVDGSVLHLASVDDYLGDRRTRFFGEGYKRATHRLSEIESAGGDGEEVVSATATVGYPSDWSRKGAVDQLPHLSTLDVLLLGVQMAEIWLARHGGLTAAARASAWVRQAQIKAGSAPVEEELEAFVVDARRTGRSGSPGAADRAISTLECAIGTLRVRLEVDHPAREIHVDQVTDPLGEQSRRPFGDAYRARSQEVTDVQVAPDRLSAQARLTLRASNGAAEPGIGIEGDFQPSAGLIDVFVVALQLGQILLYELDALTRAESNTLWMRTTRWEADSPARAIEGSRAITVELRDAAVLRNRHGERWRRADIVTELSGIALTCSVAHQLPDTATPSPADK